MDKKRIIHAIWVEELRKSKDEIVKRQKILDFEYLKTQVYDLEQKNIFLEKELKSVKLAMNVVWNAVQRIPILKAETTILPEDLEDLSELHNFGEVKS